MSTSGPVGRSPPSCPAVLSVALLSQTYVLFHCPALQRSLSNHKDFTAIHHQLTRSIGKPAHQCLGLAWWYGLVYVTVRQQSHRPCLRDLNNKDRGLRSSSKRKSKITGNIQHKAVDVLLEVGFVFQSCHPHCILQRKGCIAATENRFVSHLCA